MFQKHHLCLLFEECDKVPNSQSIISLLISSTATDKLKW